MRLPRNAALAALAVAGLVALPSIASAAYAVRAVNERAGPGTGYAVLATIPAGSYVAVHSCASSWCQVTWQGITGWVSARYIGAGGAVYAEPAYPPAVIVAPTIGYGLEYGWSFDRFDDRYYHRRHVYPGHRPPPRPPRPPKVGQVGGVPPHLQRPGTNYSAGQYSHTPAIRGGRPCLLKQRCS